MYPHTRAQISSILRKSDAERSADDVALLDSAPVLVKHARKLQDRVDQSKQRLLEQEDPYDVIDTKAQQLADWLSRARHLVCYTGAGISTAARIPDYRGSNGIWTRMQKGESIGQHDLSQAEPTFTHMALFELHRQRILQYVLSQNCDGLHLRSGVPREALSEVHGNMYVEVCKACKPNVEYLRVFDTTELTARFCHKTNRQCHVCGQPLVDTIVHFGERGSLRWPLNWAGASAHSEKADVILCLGSSLKVLKKYSWLWQMDRPRGKRPKLCIVNLQWTPKDAFADLKVNGKCDVVMALVMKYMGIRVRGYVRQRDPIFAHATLLTAEEEHTVTQPMLKRGIDAEEEDEAGDETTATETEDTAETSDNAEPDGDDDSFEEEEGDFGEEEEENDDRLTGEEETDSESSECSANCDCNRPMHTDVKCAEQIKDENVTAGDLDEKKKTKILLPVITKPVIDSVFKTESTSMVKTENGDAIKSESVPTDDLSIKPDMDGELPAELLTNRPAVKLEVGSTNGTTEPPQPNPPTIILISDSDESMSSASATTYVSSNDSTSATSAPLPSTSAVPPPSARKPPATSTATTHHHPPPPPVPFFNTSPLGLRTISPQRKPDSSPKMALSSTKRPVKQRLPYWYEPNYVYAGLHTLVHPAPGDVHLFRTTTKSAHQLDVTRAECTFCFGHYAESRCLFYRPYGPEHPHARRTRNGRLIVCECCSSESGTNDSATAVRRNVEPTAAADDNEMAGMLLDYEEGEQSVSGDGDDGNGGDGAANATVLLEQTDDSVEASEGGEKRSKLDETAAAGGRVIQPGWYGKGYRKSRRRRRM